MKKLILPFIMAMAFNQVEAKNSIDFNSFVDSKVVLHSELAANFEAPILLEDCKWTMVTVVKTTSIFFLGYHIGTTVETSTEIRCI